MSELINTSKLQIEKQELLNRIEAAEFHTNHYLEQLQEFKVKYQKLQQENKILREALEFYADGDGDVLDWDRVNNPACIQDRGKKAREALEKIMNHGGENDK